MTGCYLFDIDGTLADLSHRLHYIKPAGGPKNWDAFSHCSGYTLVSPQRRLLGQQPADQLVPHCRSPSSSHPRLPPSDSVRARQAWRALSVEDTVCLSDLPPSRFIMVK